MRKFTISLLFAFCLVLGKQTHGSLMISGFAEEVNNPFLVPSKFVLPSGTPIYLSYLAALKDAQEHHKVGILVFFYDDPNLHTQEDQYLWESLISENVCIPELLLREINIVVMRRGMVQPSEFYPKMDPILFHMIDFLERFPTLDLAQPSVILISVNEDGQDTLQEVRALHIK